MSTLIFNNIYKEIKERIKYYILSLWTTGDVQF